MIKKYLFFLSILFVCRCGNPAQNFSEHPEAKGGRVYGGTLKINETDSYVTLFPHSISDAVSHNIASQIHDGLVRIDPKNISQILPCIAEKWQVSEDGTVYMFMLKQGVMFHDNACFPGEKGREVKAEDFKYSFQLLCTDSEENQLFEFKNIVKGANEYFEASKKEKPGFDIEGIKVLSDYSLQITLISPSNNFLHILAGPAGFVIPREAIEKYGNKTTVGAGAFVLNSAEAGSPILLLRNPSYHRTDSIGNQLPFLDSVLISFILDKPKELEAFKAGDIHIVFGLPAASISEMVEAQIADFSSKDPKYYLQRNSELLTQYYQFNITRKPFNDVKVRQAFSYAIDRDKIISDVLNTEAFGPGICGLTPPGISGYDITGITGYHFNPKKAKQLLTEAGYPNGKNFPRVNIEINSGGGKYLAIVEEIKKQLKDILNVDVDFVVVPFAQKLEDAKYSRGAEIFRSGWVADYPSPENFLRTMYGAYVPDSLNEPSYPNTVRYKNPVFDSLLVQGFTSQKQEDAYRNFMLAEQIMMNDAPIIVLWYAENLKMIHSFVRNFYFNPMNHKDFSEVYIKRKESINN